MNLNTLFDKLTNFKIKFTKDPSPIEVSNMDLVFIMAGDNTQRVCRFKGIELNTDVGTVEILID